MTQLVDSANAVSVRCRSWADSDECETKALMPCASIAVASRSASRLESTKISFLSPRCSAATTMAALSSEPT